MKVSLVINSKDHVEQWLAQLFKTAESFDEIICYFDGMVVSMIGEFGKNIKAISDYKQRDIKDGFNFAASQATGDWICPFCDDDYFIVGEVQNLISEIKSGKHDDADIIHYPVYTGCGMWGNFPSFTYEQLKESNKVPHGSFIRKSVFDELGGYKVNAGADWNLWLRAKKAGYRFKYYPRAVYFFREGHHRSAWQKQLREFGLEGIRNGVIENE